MGNHFFSFFNWIFICISMGYCILFLLWIIIQYYLILLFKLLKDLAIRSSFQLASISLCHTTCHFEVLFSIYFLIKKFLKIHSCIWERESAHAHREREKKRENQTPRRAGSLTPLNSRAWGSWFEPKADAQLTELPSCARFCFLNNFWLSIL